MSVAAATYADGVTDSDPPSVRAVRAPEPAALLSDVEALYTTNPAKPQARKISDVWNEADLADIDFETRSTTVGTGREAVSSPRENSGASNRVTPMDRPTPG